MSLIKYFKKLSYIALHLQKGFKKTNTLDELLEFFKDYKVENIFMRKYNQQNNKPFKVSFLLLLFFLNVVFISFIFVCVDGGEGNKAVRRKRE